MRNRKFLILEDGSTYAGYGFGFSKEVIGEVVFNTSMTGYQEMLTDPSYGGQILVSTYPMIGNYGISKNINESHKIQVQAYIVRELCDVPVHYKSEKSLEDYLLQFKIPGICDLDTRAIAKKLRSHGSMMGIISDDSDTEKGIEKISNYGNYDEINFVEKVSTERIKEFFNEGDENDLSVALIDLGVKNNIIRLLNKKGCRVTVFPYSVKPGDILSKEFDGIVLSPGPGDPAKLIDVTVNMKKIVENLPTLAICLGHQIIATAFGGTTFKLLFGHRGSNQPVKELSSGRVYPTAQNHGFAVSSTNFPDELEVTHININDNTISGFRHREKPIISIQYHSEACPGPLDSEYIFDDFVKLIRLSKQS